jgi:hypothetical protein
LDLLLLAVQVKGFRAEAAEYRRDRREEPGEGLFGGEVFGSRKDAKAQRKAFRDSSLRLWCASETGESCGMKGIHHVNYPFGM